MTDIGCILVTGDDGSLRVEFGQRFDTLHAFVERHVAEGRGSRVAIHTVDGDVDYATLAANVARYANALAAIGLRRGNRLCMVVADCPEFFYLFWGAIKAGIVPVPLNTLLRAADYAYILDDAKCWLVVHSPEFESEVASACERASGRPQFVCVDEVARRAAQCPPHAATVHARPDEDCYWLYSSGSTGSPKGVIHTHRTLPALCLLFSESVLGACADDVFLSVPRLAFSYGMGIAMATPLWLGAAVILDRRRPNADVVAELFRRFSPTVFAAVPTFYAMLLASESLRREDVTRLRRCLSGGEATPDELLRRWVALTGEPILEVIGSTEAGFIYIGNRPGETRAGTLGKPVPGYRVRIVDDAGHDVPDDTPGRLLVSGPTVMRGYWNKPEKSARTLADGWLDTGDTLLRDREGYYLYCGRSDDMLKVGGRWVSPFEIESAIVRHDDVLEAAVIGRADDQGLVKPEAWVVLKAQRRPSDVLADEIRACCKQHLAPYKYPRWIRFVDELPKTATGKVQRFRLRQLAARDKE